MVEAIRGIANPSYTKVVRSEGNQRDGSAVVVPKDTYPKSFPRVSADGTNIEFSASTRTVTDSPLPTESTGPSSSQPPRQPTGLAESAKGAIIDVYI